MSYVIGRNIEHISRIRNAVMSSSHYARCVAVVIMFVHLRPCRRVRLHLAALAILIFVLTLSIILLHNLPSYPSTNVDQLEGVRHERGQTCVLPSLRLDKHAPVIHPLTCHKTEMNWVTVHNGTIYVSGHARDSYGNVSCKITQILRGKDDFKTVDGATSVTIMKSTVLVSDFFTANCRSNKGGHSYTNIHSGIASKKIAPPPPPPPAAAARTFDQPSMNVVIIGYDTVSRISWLRNLPQSHDYFVHKLGGVVLQGYNIVGDGTPAALLPILTGYNEEELPEARRGHTGAQPVDNHPWIWNAFKKHGYVTQFAEDSSVFATFNYRMLGFKEQPVDHYMRPFYLRVDKVSGSHRPYCLGSTTRHSNFLRWVDDLFTAYTNTPKFSFAFHGELSHDSYSQIHLADDELLSFLQSMDVRGHWNNTLLIMMADHGPRFVNMRRTVQGKYEERMPYMGLRFPGWFRKEHPTAMRHLQENIMRLTTPYDIHETLEEVVQGSVKHKRSKKLRRGMSLLGAIPMTRTCAQAGVDPHWCSCLNWLTVDVQSDVVSKAAAELVNRINEITAEQRHQCHQLQLSSITNAVKYSVSEQVAKFVSSSDNDGRVAKFDNAVNVKDALYQITIETLPGKALYEATVRFVFAGNLFVTNAKDISRINKYGEQSSCVADTLPHLRKFCYCKR